jgi:hypothetical protein
VDRYGWENFDFSSVIKLSMKKINNYRYQGDDNIFILGFWWYNAYGEVSDDNLSSPNLDLPGFG